MARFKYVAKDMSGKVHKGTVEAASENALTQQLREENLYLVEAKDLNGAKKHKKLKAKQLAAFCRELFMIRGAIFLMIYVINTSFSGTEWRNEIF